ncbi:hypothetical protein VTJ49DRAFT_3828 [Mycothermus thermophilus]|uniref:Uncharacterized protein n=1 Tax=Humicola insolens TaxID=85995 RepID=A0ABR3VR65_HUMIN
MNGAHANGLPNVGERSLNAAWNNWATMFGHQDPNRLSSGLHPLQLKELCDAVKGFVRTTENGGLPAELVSGGSAAISTLLNGMLAHYICAEIIKSPMWVFVATSIGTLESPSIPPPKPLPYLPPVAFRMDMTNFGDVAPLRPVPGPTPGSPQFPPPLITSMIPPFASGASFLGLPLKHDMERLVHIITDAQEETARISAHQWRAHLMRLLMDGGFGLKDVAAAGKGDTRRTFVESRLNYTRKLRERFLGGAARYLLQDQDSLGIERLEGMLTDMIDDALRFSCRLWTRLVPVRLQTWNHLENKEFLSPNHLVTLCHAQAPGPRKNGGQEAKEKPNGPPRDDQEGRAITMIVQPAIVTDTKDIPGHDKGKDEEVLVWLRARVMVEGPLAPDSPADFPSRGDGLQSKTPSPQTFTAPLSQSSSPSGPETVVDVLPPSSYKG